MGDKWVNVYRCRACGYLKANYQAIWLHIYIKHPEISPRDAKKYIDFVFRVSAKEARRRRELYRLKKRAGLKPKQSTRLVM